MQPRRVGCGTSVTAESCINSWRAHVAIDFGGDCVTSRTLDTWSVLRLGDAVCCNTWLHSYHLAASTILYRLFFIFSFFVIIFFLFLIIIHGYNYFRFFRHHIIEFLVFLSINCSFHLFIFFQFVFILSFFFRCVVRILSTFMLNYIPNSFYSSLFLFVGSVWPFLLFFMNYFFGGGLIFHK